MAYMSVDVNVLIEDCQVDEPNPLEIDPRRLRSLCQVIREIAGSMMVVAADVCGFYIPKRMERSDLERCIDNLQDKLKNHKQR